MLEHLRTSVLLVAMMAILTGFAFPLVVTGLARAAFPLQSTGSLVERDGEVVGSYLIGQGFAQPGYFHPRPSAAGSGGYDAGSSGGTNLAPTSAKLIEGIHKTLPSGEDDPGNFDGVKDLAAEYRQENGLADTAPVPADAVTRSASGLDPHISPANAELQVPRVARERGLAEVAVRDLVSRHTEARVAGILGEPRVNVLRLNLALDGLAPDEPGTES